MPEIPETMTVLDTVSLNNRIAIVTGGSRGIGKAISLELARRGASIAIIYGNPRRSGKAKETLNEIHKIGIGVKAIAICADLKNLDTPGRIVKETLEGLGTQKIHILVHNAGVASTVTTPDLTPEMYSDLMDTNVRAPLFLTQAALPFIPPGGRIILMSSIGARYPTPGLPTPIYSASKAAMEAFARCWAFEFGQSHGITVNAINPGLIATDILEVIDPEVLGPLTMETAKNTAAAPRFGSVDDVAQIVAFLASEGSRWVTGSTVSANGGRIVF